MQSWAPRGIAGRGVLVDYDSWATKNNTTYDRLSSHAIHHDDIISILKENNVVLQKGDILLLRTGTYPCSIRTLADQSTRISAGLS